MKQILMLFQRQNNEYSKSSNSFVTLNAQSLMFVVYIGKLQEMLWNV